MQLGAPGEAGNKVREPGGNQILKAWQGTGGGEVYSNCCGGFPTQQRPDRVFVTKRQPSCGMRGFLRGRVEAGGGGGGRRETGAVHGHQGDG